MFRQMIIVACIAAALVTTGCAKKKPAATAASDSAVTMPEVAANKDSTDIFDEFYNENKAAGKTDPAVTENAAAKQPATRAMAPIAPANTSSGANLDPNGRYVVQVASVMSEQLANSIVQKLKAKGLPAYISTIENPTPELIGTYFRVRVGGFAGITAAKEFGQKYLAGDGYEYWVASRGDEGTGGIGLGGSQ